VSVEKEEWAQLLGMLSYLCKDLGSRLQCLASLVSLSSVFVTVTGAVASQVQDSLIPVIGTKCSLIIQNLVRSALMMEV
jgi:hypothetical protein